MLLIAEFKQYFFGMSIAITSLFLVLLVLVQRGRGGGLTGALGGAGGQSAFGTKAGDLFTRITIVVAAVWIVLCAGAVYFLKDRALPGSAVDDRQTSSMTSTADPLTGSATANPTGSAATGSSATGSSATGSSATGNAAAVALPQVSTPTATTPANSVAPANSADAAPLELEPAADAADATDAADAADATVVEEATADGAAEAP